MQNPAPQRWLASEPVNRIDWHFQAAGGWRVIHGGSISAQGITRTGHPGGGERKRDRSGPELGRIASKTEGYHE